MPIIPNQELAEVDPRESMQNARLAPEYAGAAGAALERLGEAGSLAAKAYETEQYKLATYNAVQTTQDFQTQQAIKLQDAARNAPNGAPNLARDFLDGYAKDESDAMQQVDPRVAQKFSPRFNEVKQHFVLQAYQAEQGKRDEYYKTSVAKNISDGMASVDADPSTYDAVSQQVMMNINTTSLPEDVKQTFRDNWNNSAGPQALYTKRVQMDPQLARENLGGAFSLGGAIAPGTGTSAANQGRNLGLTPGGPLSTITTNSGANFQVASPYAHQFANFLQGLEAEGYKINPRTSSGFSPRNIAGTNKLSQHAYGNAIDINPEENTDSAGGKNNLPSNVKELAEANGLVWLGDAHRQDTMHFEVSKPMRQEDLPKYEGAIRVEAAAPDTAVHPSTITDPGRLMILNSVRGKAQEVGIAPDVAAASLYLDNNKMDPGSVSASGMQGLYQLDSDHQTKYGETQTVAGQINAGVRSLKEREDSARQFLGRDPEPWETYLFRYQGEGGAAALLKANANDSVYDALERGTGKQHAAAVLIANPDTRNKTVGDFLNGLKIRMNNALNVTGGQFNPDMPTTTPEFAGVSYPDLAKMRASADANIQAKLAAEAKAETTYTAEQADAAKKDLLTQFSQSKLTTEAVMGKSDYLDATALEHYLHLADMQNDVNKRSDEETAVQLKVMASDPNNADKVYPIALQALKTKGQGGINTADFRNIWQTAQETMNADTAMKARDFKAIKDDVTRQMHLMISPRVGNVTNPKFDAEFLGAKLALDTWGIAHSTATAQDIIDKATSIVAPIKDAHTRDDNFRGGLALVGVKDMSKLRQS